MPTFAKFMRKKNDMNGRPPHGKTGDDVDDCQTGSISRQCEPEESKR
jgi:hypothetical protein